MWLGQKRWDSGPSCCLNHYFWWISNTFMIWESLSPGSYGSCQPLQGPVISLYIDSCWLLAVSLGQQQHADWQSDSVPLEVASSQSFISCSPRSRYMYLWRMQFFLSCTLILSWEHFLVGCNRHHCIFCPTLCRVVRYSGVCLYIAINCGGCFRNLCFFKINTKAKQSNRLPQNKALPFFPTCTANIK